MITDVLPHVEIAHLPTPVEPMPRLSSRLNGPALWVKRDDQTGLATGGNKARKLEFLVADALSEQADTLITCGASQSNHARQTAAAAARFGLQAVLVLRGEAPSAVRGNFLLDRLLGANIVWAGDQSLSERMESVSQDLSNAGRRPYVVPYGGSNPLGVSGYVAAMVELADQSREQDLAFDHIVLASSSGGTQAGLVVGAQMVGYRGHILGISVEPDATTLQSRLADLATSTSDRLDLNLGFEPQDFDVNDDCLGGGYGVVGDLERQAIHTVATAEGLLLDPVYTGRAFGGLLDLIQHGAFERDETVLFWHTGGTGGLFAKGAELLRPEASDATYGPSDEQLP
ncbi:MAG: D-cysteine desulfhydrase family protein [Anaerolineae bacterium]|jgi:D-cysteine desulfhydrase family pyridoxal phosphate-dependent enzyme